jgi:hypothetical protein
MLQFVAMLAAIALTTLCWGAYGPVLHFGREAMHSSLRPFVCVGAAYFVIAVVVPLLLLAGGGERGGWTVRGVLWSLAAGVAGACGALGVILALGFGGKPIYVMPLAFGGAPVVNTLLSAWFNRAFDQLKAPFLAGLVLVILGAVTVLVFKPQPAAYAAPSETAAVATDSPRPPVERKAERFVEVMVAVALSIVSWGAYGPVLHRGQAAMEGSRLRPLVCIGAAYFLVAVLVPLALLAPLGDTGTWTLRGVAWSMVGGSLGALGALGTILAFTFGGKPFTVMPVVFGGAPVINTLVTLALAHTPVESVSPFFLAGMIVVAAGAAMVLLFGPRGHAPRAAAVP